jgi:putative ABC transport system permease protein
MAEGVTSFTTLRSFRSLLRLISLAYVRRHPGQVTALALCVTLGVAAIVGAGTLIRSAVSGMEKGWTVAAGEADLRVSNGFAGVPESLLQEIRQEDGVAAASGVLTSHVRLVGQDTSAPKSFSLIGLDLLADDPIHREALHVAEAALPDPTRILTHPNAVLLDRDFAAAEGLSVGDTARIELGSGQRSLYVAGTFRSNPISALFGGALGVMDLPAAQILTDREGLLDFVDVRIASRLFSEQVRARLAARLEGLATVSAAGTRSEEFRSLISNFRLTLGVPSIIALVLGAIVIHHAASAAATRRQPQLEVVRSLGVSRRLLLSLFACEGMAVGLLGSLAGTVLGILFADLAADIVRQTISTVYRPLAFLDLAISQVHVGAAVLLGVGITTATFMGIARPRLALRGDLRMRTPSGERLRRARQRAPIGMLLIPTGVAVASLQRCGFTGEGLAAVATSGDALVLLGAGLLVPLLIVGLAPYGSRLLRAARLPTARIAWQGFSSDPVRSGIVVTSIAIGAAYVVITVGPIGSLSGAMIDWVRSNQTADLVVAAPGSIGFFPTAAPIPRQLTERIEALPEVERAEPIRLVTQPYADRWVVVAGRNPDALGTAHPLEAVAGDLERGRSAIRSGSGTIVSKHFATQYGVSVGDPIELRSPTGPVRLRVEAIATDFSSADLGTVFVSLDTLRDRWLDRGATNLQVWIRPGPGGVEAVRDRLRRALRGDGDFSILTGEEFVERSAHVIDSIFYMAYALEVFAAIVMGIATVTFFSAMLLERRAEIEALHVMGATPRQIRGSLVWEGTFIGLLGGGIGCAIGAPLAYRITKTTMRIGGGFTLDFDLPAYWVVVTILGAALLCQAAVMLVFRSAPRPVDP